LPRARKLQMGTKTPLWVTERGGEKQSSLQKYVPSFATGGYPKSIAGNQGKGLWGLETPAPFYGKLPLAVFPRRAVILGCRNNWEGEGTGETSSRLSVRGDVYSSVRTLNGSGGLKKKFFNRNC